jgi:hypothetical protein
MKSGVECDLVLGGFYSGFLQMYDVANFSFELDTTVAFLIPLNG